MDHELINACESFSEGRIEPALDFLANDVLWRVMGDRDCEGVAAVRDFCEEMTAGGCPDLTNLQTTVGERTIIVEGAEASAGGLLYCDSYTVSDGRIAEIRSYCVSPAAPEAH